MDLIVGLGNPGERYRKTRHNVGFRVVDRLAEASAGRWKKGDQYLWISMTLSGREIYLLKSLTYMNLSGEGLFSFLRRQPGREFELVVVYDDLDLPPGTIRIKKGGGTAGHRGLESIVDSLGRNDFVRVRVGIGRPAETGPTADYVLGLPLGEEEQRLEAGEGRATDAVRVIIREGLVSAMNRFNRRETGD